MDVIMSKLEIRGNISTRLREITTYADNNLVRARTKHKLIQTS
jgi:hypothetical protein